jgi:hypothetical protein
MAKRIILDLQFNVDPELKDEDIDYNILGGNDFIRNLIYQETHKGVKEAIFKKSKHAKIIELNSSGNYCIVDKDDFPSVIETLIKHYESVENYEICSELTQLRSQHESKKNTRANK